MYNYLNNNLFYMRKLEDRLVTCSLMHMYKKKIERKTKSLQRVKYVRNKTWHGFFNYKIIYLIFTIFKHLSQI